MGLIRGSTLQPQLARKVRAPHAALRAERLDQPQEDRLGKVLAQQALGLEQDVAIAPYRLSRFAEGALLTGAYGVGSIS